MTATHDAPSADPAGSLDIAIVGSGISGLSAAWLLSHRHRVTVFEQAPRTGGHSHTRIVDGQPVDTGFIVYNEVTYPNLTALFRHLSVPTKPSNMSFAVSLDDGRLEYAGHPSGLLAQPANWARRRFWSMLADLVRFYRLAPRDAARLGQMTLDEYLDARGFGDALRRDHLYPMAAAIWSTPAIDIGAYPAMAFVRFCENHGLLKLVGRPQWRTVEGGSRSYVQRLTSPFADRIETGNPVRSIRRTAAGVEIVDARGTVRRFDHVVVGTHADQALGLLENPTEEERRILSAFRYSSNRAVLHSDPGLMPRRRAVWSSWNYLSAADAEHGLSVTYWMNRLQGIPGATPLFVTLNPWREPRADLAWHSEVYEHPQFDKAAIAAQERLWSLQGVGGLWFCGAYFGAGFHEDGLQSGLAVAEDLGGLRRPWRVAGESDRIRIVRPAIRPLPARLA